MTERERHPAPGAPADQLDGGEVDALLDGWKRRRGDRSAPRPAPAPTPGHAEWREFDFRARATRLTATETDRLTRVHRSLATALGAQLGTLLRQPVRARLRGVETVDPDGFAAALADTTWRRSVATGTPPGRFLVALPARVLVPMISRLLGDDHEPGTEADRTLTPLEEELAGAVLERTLAAIEEAWRGDDAAPPLGFVADTADLSASGPSCLPGGRSAIVATVSIEIAFGADAWRVAGDLTLAIPLGPWLSFLTAPGRDQLRERSTALDPTATAEPGALALASPAAERDALLASVATEPVELTADIETSPLALDSLLETQVGDVIDTGVAAGAPVTVRLDGVPLATSRLGRHGESARAVRLDGGAKGSAASAES